MACLDTCVLIDLGRKRRAGAALAAEEIVAQLKESEQRLTTTRLNVAELYVGIERTRDAPAERRKVEQLLDGLGDPEFDDVAARAFGAMTAHLQRIGRSPGDMDVLIAAVALTSGEPLVTRNEAHFADIPGLALITYS